VSLSIFQHHPPQCSDDPRPNAITLKSQLLPFDLRKCFVTGVRPPSGCRATHSADRRGHPTPRDSLLQKKSCSSHSAGRCGHPRARRVLPTASCRRAAPPCTHFASTRPSTRPPCALLRLLVAIHHARPIRTQPLRPWCAPPPPPRRHPEKVVADQDIVSCGRQGGLVCCTCMF
jgi:hypothetical protein